LHTPSFVHTLIHPFRVVRTQGCSRSLTLIHALICLFGVIHAQGCSCSLALQLNDCKTLVFVYILCAYLLFILLETPLVPETCKRLA
jgi:hypothetical protein